MSLTLKGFSQEVDISNKDVVSYFLVFTGERDVKLPVQKETVESLVASLYGAQKEKTPEVVDDDLAEEYAYQAEAEELRDLSEQEATHFEASDDGDEVEEPQTEDDIPSL